MCETEWKKSFGRRKTFFKTIFSKYLLLWYSFWPQEAQYTTTLYLDRTKGIHVWSVHTNHKIHKIMQLRRKNILQGNTKVVWKNSRHKQGFTEKKTFLGCLFFTFHRWQKEWRTLERLSQNNIFFTSSQVINTGVKNKLEQTFIMDHKKKQNCLHFIPFTCGIVNFTFHFTFHM